EEDDEDLPELEIEDVHPVASFERFELPIPREAVEDITNSIDADEAVSHWASRIYRPDHITPEKLANELRESGGWLPEELGDDDTNWRRTIWLAAHHIKNWERENED